MVPLSVLLDHASLHSHTPTHSLSLVLVDMIILKELKTKISLTDSLILPHCLPLNTSFSLSLPLIARWDLHFCSVPTTFQKFATFCFSLPSSVRAASRLTCGDCSSPSPVPLSPPPADGLSFSQLTSDRSPKQLPKGRKGTTFAPTPNAQKMKLTIQSIERRMRVCFFLSL